MATVEIASTFPTVLTSTGINFCDAFVTTTGTPSGGVGGAASFLAQAAAIIPTARIVVILRYQLRVFMIKSCILNYLHHRRAGLPAFTLTDLFISLCTQREGSGRGLAWRLNDGFALHRKPRSVQR